MYLDEMVKTLKSQIIKALTYFFAKQEESYRLICLASTYHLVLGISKESQKELLASLIAARAKLQNVDYIFIDQIGMVESVTVFCAT